MGALIFACGLLLMAAAGTAMLLRWRRQRSLRAALWARLDALDAGHVRVDRQPQDWLSRWLAAGPPFLQVWLGRADVHPQGRSVLMALLLLLTIIAAIGKLFGVGPALAALALGLAAPLAALYGLSRYRLKVFLEGLPYFLDAVRQLLTVGNSIQQALLKGCDAASPAVQRYMQPVMRRIVNGAPIPDAITMAADRIATPELYMLATAVRTNIRFGGPVGPILGDFAEMLRARARVAREISAATAETRMSAVILCSLPFVAIAMLSVVSHQYISFLWVTPLGHKLLLTAALLQVTGVLVMRRLMRVDF